MSRVSDQVWFFTNKDRNSDRLLISAIEYHRKHDAKSLNLFPWIFWVSWNTHDA
jgi:hypothetical protein